MALARASGRSPPHGGNYSALGNERAKPLAFPSIKKTEAISLPQPQLGTGNGTLARRDADGRRGGKRSGGKAVVPKGQRLRSP